MFNGRFPNKQATKCNRIAHVDYKRVVTCEKPVYAPLLINDHGDDTFTYLSDVDLLFNQQRLDRMSLAALQQKLDDMTRIQNDGLSELRKNIKDEDLMKFIKSRYIQAPSELRAWCSYLAEEYGTAESGIRQLIADAQKKADDSSSASDDSSQGSQAE